ETKLDMLEDEPGAIHAYERALELDPESAMTVDSLILLYEPGEGLTNGAAHPGGHAGVPSKPKKPERLVELYQRRVELAAGDEEDLRYTLNVRAAGVFEKELQNPREAINS